MIALLHCPVIIMLLLVHCKMLLSSVAAPQIYVMQGQWAVIIQLTKLVDSMAVVAETFEQHST